MKHNLRTFFTGIFLFTALSTSANAEQILQLFPGDAKGCTSTVKINLGSAIRSGIEAEVKRSDDALKKPQSIKALGCLDNLMTTNLDIAIPVPNLEGIFASAVSQVEGQICSFAQSKLNELTAKVSELLQLPNFNFLPMGGLTGGQSTEIGSVNLTFGGGEIGQGVQAGTNPIAPTNLDAVYQLIYGGSN